MVSAALAVEEEHLEATADAEHLEATADAEEEAPSAPAEEVDSVSVGVAAEVTIDPVGELPEPVVPQEDVPSAPAEGGDSSRVGVVAEVTTDPAAGLPEPVEAQAEAAAAVPLATDKRAGAETTTAARKRRRGAGTAADGSPEKTAKPGGLNVRIGATNVELAETTMASGVKGYYSCQKIVTKIDGKERRMQCLIQLTPWAGDD